MLNNINLARKLEDIRVAIENSDSNSFITVWVPIIVVFIGAFIAYTVSQIEKNRQRKNLKHTVVLWLRESIKSIDGFICVLNRLVEESKSASVLESKRVFGPQFHLQCIKEFPIDKMSDALVSRLRVRKKEKKELAQKFYDLYDFTITFTDTQTKILEAHNDYNKKIASLSQQWNEHFAEFSYLINNYLLSQDITDSERQFLKKVETIVLEMLDQVAKAGGVYRRDILQNFIHKMSDAFTKTSFTQRIIEVNKNCNKIRMIILNMESLHADRIQVFQTQQNLLSSSKEYFMGIVSFYEQHKIKGIFSFSNRVA